MEDYTLVYTGNAIINVISMIILLISGILLLLKKRSAGTFLVFIGSLLYTLASIGSLLANLVAGRIGEEAVLRTHAFTSVGVALAFLIFSIGLLKLVTEIRSPG